MAAPFPETYSDTGVDPEVATTVFGADGIYLQCRMPKPSLQQFDFLNQAPTLAAVSLARSTYDFYVNKQVTITTPFSTLFPVPTFKLFAPLALASSATVGTMTTRINLLPKLIADPYTALGISQPSIDYAAYSVVPDQLRYNINKGAGRQLLGSLLGKAHIYPESVDLTGYSPVIYSQGVLPNSFAHSLAQIVNINRTTTQIVANQVPSLDAALSVTTAMLPSRMHMSYTANRMGAQVQQLFTLDPAWQNVAYAGSSDVGPPLSWVPIFGFKQIGAVMESAYAHPGSINDDPLIAPPAKPGPKGKSKLYQQHALPLDAHIGPATPTVTKDMGNLQWRNLSDLSLGVGDLATGGGTTSSRMIPAKKLHKLIKSHLASSIPLTLHTNVYNSFAAQMNVDPNNPLVPLPLSGETPIGSHHFTIAGYTQNDHYILMNSFGPNVGAGGLFTMHKDYITGEQNNGAGTGVYMVSSPCWVSDAALKKCPPPPGLGGIGCGLTSKFRSLGS